MSDNTANAREPSMEDILASIRRIIDEEDTRDARPASDHITPVENRARASQEGALPVMAAAPVSRDDDGGLFDEVDERLPGGKDAGDTLDAFDALDDAQDNDGDSVFPERESPFWSRATGRDGTDSVSDDNGIGDEYTGAFDIEPDSTEASDDAGRDDLSGSRTDIFTRAQNKLEGGQRLSTRERMQNLAARAEERAGATAREDVVAPDFGQISGDDAGETPDDERAVSVSVDAPLDDLDSLHDGAERVTTRITTPEDADVLDLTNPMERATDTSDKTAFTLIDEATPQADDRGEENADGQGEQGETTSLAMPSESVESSSWTNDTNESRDRSHDMDDVLDLTTPLGGLAAVDTGSVESGEAFHVSGVEENDADDGGIEDMISRNLVQDDAGLESDVPAGFDAPVESRYTEDLHDTADDFRENTYSRFDSVEETAEEAEGNEEPRNEDALPLPTMPETPEVADTYSAAFVTLDETPSTLGEFGIEDTAIADVEEPVEDILPENDVPESGENLGFPDTFGASDVYHDEPPALDEDYSRSLGDGDELAAEQAAFAAQMQKDDDGMEAVGGMVRDAMERDPVDYSDPAALVSMTSEEISARALASLADVEGEASRRVYGSLRINESDSGAGDSLEGMVRGMLKPMLREWLDDNLPTMVESAVRGEVERISSKSRKYSRAADNG